MFDLLSNTWSYITGNRTGNLPSDYDAAYPGGVYHQTMVIDHKDRYLYVFGGRGYNESVLGIEQGRIDR